jgi:hypothetical protein
MGEKNGDCNVPLFCTGSCPSCGIFQKTNYFSNVALHDNVTDVCSAVMDSLFECKEELCPQCQSHQAKTYVHDVKMPLCPVVQLQR